MKGNGKAQQAGPLLSSKKQKQNQMTSPAPKLKIMYNVDTIESDEDDIVDGEIAAATAPASVLDNLINILSVISTTKPANVNERRMAIIERFLRDWREASDDQRIANPKKNKDVDEGMTAGEQIE